MSFLSKLFKKKPTLSIDFFNYTDEVPLEELSDSDIITIEFTRFIFNGILENYSKIAKDVPGIAKMQKKDSKFIPNSSIELCLFLWYSFYASMDKLEISQSVTRALFVSLESSIEKLINVEIKQVGYINFRHFVDDRHTLFNNIIQLETPKKIGFNLEHRYVPLLMRRPLSYATDIYLKDDPYIYIGDPLESAWGNQYLAKSINIFDNKFREQLLQNTTQPPSPTLLTALRKR